MNREAASPAGNPATLHVVASHGMLLLLKDTTENRFLADLQLLKENH